MSTLTDTQSDLIDTLTSVRLFAAIFIEFENNGNKSLLCMMLKPQLFSMLLKPLVVVCILALPLLVTQPNVSFTLTSSSTLYYFGYFASFILLYLIHRYWLMPKMYLTKKFTLYFLSLLVMLVILLMAKPFDRLLSALRTPPHELEMHDGPPPPPDHFENRLDRRGDHPPFGPERRKGPKIDVFTIFLFLIIIIVELITETNKQLNLTTQRAISAEKEKAQAELSFLKAQVNPHFLFNTLNNIYTLAIIKDENTAPSIMKLSNIMRYITDEASDDEVSLQQEISCIADFVSLQKMRLGKKNELNYEVSGDFTGEKKIAPLILMAFVENVFKYGVSNHTNSKLIIKLAVENKTLSLFCQNPIHPDKLNTERSGIGLNNTKKRLQHLYPEQHLLAISDDGEQFAVKLTIYL